MTKDQSELIEPPASPELTTVVPTEPKAAMSATLPNTTPIVLFGSEKEGSVTEKDEL